MPSMSNLFKVSSVDFEAEHSEECNKSSDEVQSRVQFILSSTTSDSECSLAESTFSDVPLLIDENSEQPHKFSSVLQKFLRRWSIQHNVTHNCLSDLLRGLKDTVPVLSSALPSDARTLLKTFKIKFCSRIVFPGKYIHIGLEKQLKTIISGSFQDLIDSFRLIINIDGIPIFICILFQNGKTIPVKVVAFCCDAPAKADILGIKSFSIIHVRDVLLKVKRVTVIEYLQILIVC